MREFERPRGKIGTPCRVSAFADRFFQRWRSPPAGFLPAGCLGRFFRHDPSPAVNQQRGLDRCFNLYMGRTPHVAAKVFVLYLYHEW